jgi:hypothetical protein
VSLVLSACFGSRPPAAVSKLANSFTPLSKVVPGLPPGLDAALARALIADPKARTDAPKELVAALDALTASSAPSPR